MNDLWHHVEQSFLIEPNVLYEKIKAAGYEWETLLEKTRGWWAPEGSNHLLFLSTWDLLKMAEGTYHPYWLEADKKTIKKEYVYKVVTDSSAKSKPTKQKELIEETV